MKPQTDFQFSILSPAGKIADHLEALAKAIRKGRIELRSGDELLLLEPEGELDFYLKAYRRGTRNKVSFDIKWKNQPDTMMDLDIIAASKGNEGKE